MKKYLLFLLLSCTSAYAENEILLKAGPTTTYPNDSWSTTNTPRIRLGIEYRSMLNTENLLSGLYGIEVAYSKLPVDWSKTDYNEWDNSFKIGMCAGYEVKFCPIIGMTQQLIKGQQEWSHIWGSNIGLNLLVIPKKNRIISGFELTKRTSVIHLDNISYRWDKVDLNAMIGIRF